MHNKVARLIIESRIQTTLLTPNIRKSRQADLYKGQKRDIRCGTMFQENLCIVPSLSHCSSPQEFFSQQKSYNLYKDHNSVSVDS